jgi:hypothetical protein
MYSTSMIGTKNRPHRDVGDGSRTAATGEAMAPRQSISGRANAAAFVIIGRGNSSVWGSGSPPWN